MKKLVGLAVLAILAATAVWVFRRPSVRDSRPASNAAGSDPPAHSVNDAPDAVTLPRRAARRMGLRVTVLKPARHAEALKTTAVVLSPRGLARLDAAYVAESEKLGVARANLAFARNEYKRQRVLYRADQTTSLKALQSAHEALVTSQAQTRNDRSQLQIDALDVDQSWGPVLQKWLVARSVAFRSILRQREWLVQLTLSGRAARLRPETVRLVSPSGVVVTGRYLSSFPKSNPLIQGLNYLYVIPARTGFAPGLDLAAEVPAGPMLRGVVIPSAAIVWTGGEAWAYKQVAPSQFLRLPVSTSEPVPGGWFVTRKFAPGNRVVTHAAEELFSTETQPAGGAGDDD